MDNEESLMNVLTRLSFSIEQAMNQKKVVEKKLIDAQEQVKMLTQANEALMKHVASLEKRNEVVVSGLLKIVETVEKHCEKIKGASEGIEVTSEVIETRSTEEDSITLEKAMATASSGSTANPTSENEVIAPVDIANEPVENAVDDVLPGLDDEPESAELRSLAEHPIDPLVYSNIMDYAAEPEILPTYHRIRSSGSLRSSRMRSGRVRGGKLRSSGGLFRRPRTRDSYVDGSRSVESRRCRRSGGVRRDVNGIPVPDAGCGCFLQTLFGCRR